MWIRHKTKILSLLLAISVLANLGFISMEAGKRAGHMMGKGRPGVQEFMKMSEELPAEGKQAVREAVMRRGDDMKTAAQAIMEKKTAIQTLLKEPKVDKVQLEQEFSALRALITSIQEIRHAMVMEMVDHIPPEKRAALLERRKRNHK